MTPKTINDIFFAIVGRRHDRVMLVHEGARVGAHQLAAVLQERGGYGAGPQSWGLVKGDRIAILSENRHEWAVADFASLLVGTVVVPIYATLTAQQTAHILCDSGAKIVVVSTQTQLEKTLSIQDQTAVERVVVMDPVDTADAVQMTRLMQEDQAIVIPNWRPARERSEKAIWPPSSTHLEPPAPPKECNSRTAISRRMCYIPSKGSMFTPATLAFLFCPYPISLHAMPTWHCFSAV